MLDFVESRVANPVRMADWDAVEEGQAIVCPCCGWAGRLGMCRTEAVAGARAYSCPECSMTLVARVLPVLVPFRIVRAGNEWRCDDLLASNF